MHTTIKSAIVAELRRRGWRTCDLARAVGWPHQHVSRYLTGRNDILDVRADELLYALGLEIRPEDRDE